VSENKTGQGWRRIKEKSSGCEATAAALTVVAQGRTRKGGAVKQIKLGLGSGVDGSGQCDAGGGGGGGGGSSGGGRGGVLSAGTIYYY
jgi:hypothetical protein